ncbi:hypothetical protein BX600DRAFT_461347 [Xylariales sp. PMI_506]|nr:hypothetical protein BX600DRAFT_461347 [Xylariales sp. PMI_506]
MCSLRGLVCRNQHISLVPFPFLLPPASATSLLARGSPTSQHLFCCSATMSSTRPNVTIALTIALLLILFGFLIWKARAIAKDFAHKMFSSRGRSHDQPQV